MVLLIFMFNVLYFVYKYISGLGTTFREYMYRTTVGNVNLKNEKAAHVYPCTRCLDILCLNHDLLAFSAYNMR